MPFSEIYIRVDVNRKKCIFAVPKKELYAKIGEHINKK